MAAVHFHWVDYCVFVLILAITVSVGIYFCWTGYKRKEGSDGFMMGGRDMHVIPVSCSLFVSWLSAIAFIGK